MLGVVKEGTILPYAGQKSDDGWLMVKYGNTTGWISGLYGELVI